MSTTHKVLFIILIVLSLFALAGVIITGNGLGIGMALSILGVLVFSFGVSGDYAALSNYYKQVQPLLEEQVKLLEDLRKNHEEQIATLTDMYHDATQQRLNLLASLISYEAAFNEFLNENNPHPIKYASRWLDKGKEIQKLIDESYNRESLDNWTEISEGLFKYREQFKNGEIDIDRTV